MVAEHLKYVFDILDVAMSLEICSSIKACGVGIMESTFLGVTSINSLKEWNTIGCMVSVNCPNIISTTMPVQ